MSILDIILLICFIPAVIRGISKGFVEQLIALLSIIIGAWVAYHFGGTLSEWAAGYLQVNEKVLNVICFTLIIIVAVVLLFLVGRLITGVIKIVMLGWLNRLLGVVFALLKVALVLGLLVTLFTSLNDIFGLVKQETLDSSFMYSGLKNFADTVFPYLKKLFNPAA
jgi:membrane protein required for colicin V production